MFNMAACELYGELKYRDGQTNQFTVQVEGDLKSLITGVKKLNADISVVLTALVEQEKGSTDNNIGVLDDDDDDEEDSDEEDITTETPTKKSQSEPPNKRIKTVRP